MTTSTVPATAAGRGASRRVRNLVLGSAFVVIATLVQLPRQSGVYMWRTVWAEDGGQFYADALARPLSEIALHSYAGYAHLVPRILASIGVHLPPAWYSVFVATTSALAAALLALFVYHASAPLLRSPTRQAVLCLALLLWPVLPFEVTGAICNIHWVMPVACLLAVLLPVERRGAVAVRIPIVVLAPLSSPLCVLFVPIAIWQLVVAVRARARPARYVTPGVYLVASAIQVLVWRTATKVPTETPPLDELGVDLAELYSTKVASGFLFGVRTAEALWDRAGYGLAVGSVIVLGAVLLWRFARAGTVARWFIAACVAASAAVYALSIWQRPNFVESMVMEPGGPFNFTGTRYDLFPGALLLLALLVPLDLSAGAFVDVVRPPGPPLRADLRDQRLVLAVSALWLLVAFVPSYRLTTWRSAGPDWVAGVRAAEQACELEPTGSVAVSITPEPVWSVVLPCSSLLAGGP